MLMFLEQQLTVTRLALVKIHVLFVSVIWDHLSPNISKTFIMIGQKWSQIAGTSGTEESGSSIRLID